MPKRGDVVVLIAGEKEYNALVLAVSAVADSHLGADGEPALHLCYVPDEPIDGSTKQPKATAPGYIPATATVFDVVHESHEFDADYMEQHGLRLVKDDDPNKVSAEAEIRNRRGAFEWRAKPEPAGKDAAADEKQPAVASD